MSMYAYKDTLEKARKILESHKDLTLEREISVNIETPLSVVA